MSGVVNMFNFCHSSCIDQDLNLGYQKFNGELKQ